MEHLPSSWLDALINLTVLSLFLRFHLGFDDEDDDDDDDEEEEEEDYEYGDDNDDDYDDDDSKGDVCKCF